MPSERDKAIENPYESPIVADDRRSIPTPISPLELIVIFVVVGVLTAFLL